MVQGTWLAALPCPQGLRVAPKIAAAIRTPDPGVVAQLGERRVRNAEVRGSSPLSSTAPQTGSELELPLGVSALYLDAYGEDFEGL